VGAARTFVADLLRSWAVPDDLIDTARLLTSELVTNAVIHGQGRDGRFLVEVRSFGCCLGVDVADTSARAPILRTPARDSEMGRGLMLVAELADSWGYYYDGARKHVWVHLHVKDPASPPPVTP
jgi:anti-sigma regulatory factor (Ser/Thr protein kinase)